MSTLLRLTAQGRNLVDDGFLSGTTPTVTFAEHQVEPIGREISLDRLDRVVRDCLKTYKPFDTKMDRAVAVKLHQALPLTCREASDYGIWHYLAVVHAPQFVRHRWAADNHGKITDNRFLGDLVRNAFARLWWGAQRTVQGDADYSATVEL